MNLVALGSTSFLGLMSEAFGDSFGERTTDLTTALERIEALSTPCALIVSFEDLGDDPLEVLLKLGAVHAQSERFVVIAIGHSRAEEAPMIEAMTRLDLFWRGAPARATMPSLLESALGSKGDPKTSMHTGSVGHLPAASEGPLGVAPEEEIAHLSLDSSGKADDAEMIEQVRADLRSLLTRVRNVAPNVVLGLQKSASEGELDEAYYRLMRDHHPDVYAHVPDPEVARLAEDVFLEIRGLRNRFKDWQEHENAEDEDADEVDAGQKNETVLEGGRIKVTYVAQPRIAPEQEERDEEKLEPGRRSTARMRAIADLAKARKEEAERERNEQEKARAARAREAAERLRRARGAGEGPQPTEQLVRAAQAAVEAGSTEKAIELYELLAARNAPVPGLRAWLAWLRWQNGDLDDEGVFSELDAAREDAGDDRKATSVALMLKGHVLRFSGAFSRAADSYKEATRQDTSNEQAFRWFKYCNQRLAQQGPTRARPTGKERKPASAGKKKNETSNSDAVGGGFLARLFRRGRS